MALSFNGTTSKLEWLGQLVTNYPVTMFAWVKPANVTTSFMAMGVGDFGGLNELNMYFDGATAGDKARAFVKNAVASWAANSLTAYTAGTWQPCMVVFESADVRRVYLQSGSFGVNTNNNALSFNLLDRFVIGCRGISDTLFFNGDISHVAVWQGLSATQAQFDFLSQGHPPSSIDPDNLVDYWTLDEQGATQTGINGTVLTATATLQAADAPTIAVVDSGVKYIGQGVWTWFTDPRAVHYNGATYLGWVSAAGHVGITRYTHATKAVEETLLHTFLEVDDHDNVAVHILPDGRIMGIYCKHADTVHRYRISTNPEDISAFDPEVTITGLDAPVTYAMPVRLSQVASRLYLFYRSKLTTGNSFGPSYIKSEDLATPAWSTQTDVFRHPGPVPSVRHPYTKHCTNGVDRIDFLMTDLHPNEGQSSVLHFYMQLDGSGVEHWYKTDGTEIAASLPFGPSDATLVSDGSVLKRWIWQIKLGTDGHPRILFTRYANNDGTDIRYMYGRWNGAAWEEHEITADGPGLYDPEVYYAGGICFDDADTDIVYLSKPVAGVREIQEWGTSDNGATWAKTRDITSGTASGTLNGRPYSPENATDEMRVVWWSGTYTTFENYDTSLMYEVGAGGAALDGTAQASASASATLTVPVELAGAALSVATAAGSVTVPIDLAGVAVSVADAAGNLQTAIQLSGAALASAMAAAGIGGAANLAGDALGESAADAALTIGVQLSGAAFAAAVAAADLSTTPAGLAGSAQAVASGTGWLSVPIALAGAAQAVATGAGGLGVPVPLAGFAAGVSEATGQIVLAANLSGAAAAMASGFANLSIAVSLAGAAVAQVSAAAALSGGSVPMSAGPRDGYWAGRMYGRPFKRDYWTNT